ncbi:MAG: diguanylate cyclase [Campylobacterota bacterium]|nr:diguanylate cyclase [Campylobacterota bacterium]
MQDKTILIVDDTITNLDILVELLDMYNIMDVTNGMDALDILNKEKIDLILLDIVMPEMDGFEVCRRIKSNPLTKDIPIIFITSKTDESSIEEAYDIGGIDYVTKPFKPKELLARVKTQLKMQELQEELRILASTDHMTKLYNRRYFTKISEHTLDLAARDNNDVSVIILDIDNFKKINDTYGHQIGDKVIIELANKLIKFQRRSDIICRYGGEEFVILLPNTSIDGAFTVAKKIRKDVELLQIKIDNNKDLKFTISLGVSQVSCDDEINIEASLKRADTALYKAKDSGRNMVCIERLI